MKNNNPTFSALIEKNHEFGKHAKFSEKLTFFTP